MSARIPKTNSRRHAYIASGASGDSGLEDFVIPFGLFGGAIAVVMIPIGLAVWLAEDSPVWGGGIIAVTLLILWASTRSLVTALRHTTRIENVPHSVREKKDRSEHDYDYYFRSEPAVRGALLAWAEITEPTLLAVAEPVYTAWRQSVLAYDADPTPAAQEQAWERSTVLKELAAKQREINSARLLADRGGPASSDEDVQAARQFLAALKDIS